MSLSDTSADRDIVTDPRRTEAMIDRAARLALVISRLIDPAEHRVYFGPGGSIVCERVDRDFPTAVA